MYYKEYSKQWYQKNKARIRIRRRKFLQKSRKQAIDTLGGKCCWCGFSDWRALQIDHINGGGTQELKHMSQRTIHKLIIERPREEWEDKYQLLCANCNWVKLYENNEHKRKYW